MKLKRLLVGVVCLLGVSSLVFWIVRFRESRTVPEWPVSSKASIVLPEPEHISPPKTNSTAWSRSGNSISAVAFTDAERAEFAKKFRDKFRPAINKWCEAYDGRVLFDPKEVTLEKFHSLMKPNLYTFVISGITLTIQEPKQGPAKVFYMADGNALQSLNSLRADDSKPDITVPITKEEVISMVKADSGVEFKRNECIIKPTGAAGGLAGGASVDMLPTGADPNNGLSSKIDLVFRADGKLVYYDRDPFF